MGWQTFTIQLIQSLAWPLTVVIVFLSLRKVITKLLPLLELEWKGISAKFRNELNKAEATASLVVEESPQTSKSSAEASKLADQTDSIIRISPEAGVVSIFSRFEKAVRAAANRLNVSPPQKLPLRVLLQAFHNVNLMSDEMLKLALGLSEMRNLAAHGGPDGAISTTDGLRFVELIHPLITYFEKLQPK